MDCERERIRMVWNDNNIKLNYKLIRILLHINWFYSWPGEGREGDRAKEREGEIEKHLRIFCAISHFMYSVYSVLPSIDWIAMWLMLRNNQQQQE